MKSVYLALLGLSSVEGIQHKFRPPVGSTPWHIENEKITVGHWVKPEDYPFNYVVPNFGDVDSDVADSLDNTKKAEKKFKKKMYSELFNEDGSAKKGVKPVVFMPRSLPNLGEDIETEQTIASLNQAEKEQRH